MSAIALRTKLEELESADAQHEYIKEASCVDSGPPQEDWGFEFEDFLGKQWEAKQLKKHNMAGAISFLQKNREEPLQSRMDFLKYKGLSDAQIDEVFTIVGQQSDLHVGKTGLKRMVEVNLRTSSEQPYDTPFRVGELVFAYVHGNLYYPGTVTQIDESRHEDILRVCFNFSPNNPYSETSHWAVVGYKGVVADTLPKAEVLIEGDAVVFALPGDEEVMHDAIIHAVQSGEDGPLFEIEYTTDDGEAREVKNADDLRTLEHPRAIDVTGNAAELRRLKAKELLEKRIEAISSFPSKGVRERMASANELSGGGGPESTEGTGLTPEECTHLGTIIRSFIRYPTLEHGPRPDRFRTYERFLQTHGEDNQKRSTGSTKSKVMPWELGQGKLDFDFSHMERHPRCAHLFAYNPILEAAQQCVRLGLNFVDPEFPPVGRNLCGPPNLLGSSPSPTAKVADVDEFEWCRASEFVAHPRPVVTGSGGLVMGELSPRWLAPAFSLWPKCPEFEDSFSPYDEPSPFGVYTVRLFVDGRWYFVLLDDFLPVYKRTPDQTSNVPVCMRSKSPNEIWPCLLEKVYAKLRGSYRALATEEGGWCLESIFTDISAGLAQLDDYRMMRDKSLWLVNLVNRLQEKDSCTVLTNVSTTKDRNIPIKDLDMHPLDCYDVQDVQVLSSVEGQATYPVVLVRNQWLNQPIAARYRDRLFRGWPAEVIDTVRELQEKVSEGGDGSRHWLPFKDYMEMFQTATTCYPLANWQRAVLHGTFKGSSGGGKWDHSNTEWFNNPQFYVTFTTSGTVAIELRLLDRRFDNRPVDGTILQMSLLKAVGYHERLQSANTLIVDSNSIDFQDDYSNAFPSVYLYLNVEPGAHILVPEIGTDSSAQEFVLKVWATCGFHGQLLDPE